MDQIVINFDPLLRTGLMLFIAVAIHSSGKNAFIQLNPSFKYLSFSAVNAVLLLELHCKQKLALLVAKYLMIVLLYTLPFQALVNSLASLY